MSHSVPPTPTEQRAENEGLGEMFKSLSNNLTTLLQQEVALAKAELSESVENSKKSAKAMGAGAGMLAGAGIAALFLLLFLSAAVMWALGSVMNLGWAALIVAALWAVIAAVLAVVGKKALKTGQQKLAEATKDPLPQTRETLSEIPDTVNPSKEIR